MYFEKVCNNINCINKESNIFENSINLLNNNIINHFELSPEMIKFYILYRSKELGLEDYLKEIIISTSTNPNCFGDYQASSETMRINYNYLKNVFEPVFNKYNCNDKMLNQDLLNKLMLQKISHELSHVLTIKKLLLLHQKQIKIVMIKTYYYIYFQINFFVLQWVKKNIEKITVNL